jgi:hypothetical protein
MKTCFLTKYIFLFILHVRIYMIIFLTIYIYKLIFLKTKTKNNFQNLFFLIIIMKITTIPNTS